MNKHLMKNPAISGYYPDPSICRAGEDYYLVCSSFEMFPGLPIFHSRDLANWEQIGNVLDRESQLHLRANSFVGGLMAPTIRYHDGLFYVIVMSTSDFGNIIVTASDPAGPWSDKIPVPDVTGIDASIFFDDDGKVYVIGTGAIHEENGRRKQGIYLNEFDLSTMKTVGPREFIFDGALRDAATPEAPHLYKKDGWYYLLIAEGGTEHYHSITVARSKTINAWYENNPANPVLTHRNLGFDAKIANVGHGDFVQTQFGDWYCVMLASRLLPGRHKNIGRETFIAPVKWENDWPLMCWDTGMLQGSYPADQQLPWTPYEPEQGFDDFDGTRLNDQWVFWGTPYQAFWKLEDSALCLKPLARDISRDVQKIQRPKPGEQVIAGSKVTDDCISLVGRRLRHPDFRISAKMQFVPEHPGDCAGIVLLRAVNHQLRFEKSMSEKGSVIRLVLVTTTMNCPPYMPDFKGLTTRAVLFEEPYSHDFVMLTLTVQDMAISASFGQSHNDAKTFRNIADFADLDPESVGCMTGTLLSMYAQSNSGTENWARFEWFNYEGLSQA